MYSGREKKATGFVYIRGSPYRDAKVSSQLRECLHAAIINAAPIIGNIIDKSELYRQCPPIRVKDTNMTELEFFDFVSSAMTVATILNIDR